jgi:hypothetical protein
MQLSKSRVAGLVAGTAISLGLCVLGTATSVADTTTIVCQPGQILINGQCQNPGNPTFNAPAPAVAAASNTSNNGHGSNGHGH